ncbi:tetratricopeptide repeat protein [Prochlorococcus marinus]|uniref:tetratricopeptide repeat protein n=1 Tax=Prochlorococcus marinus TaxID=1219 RepID=UPI0022B33F10|nr:tetratricopeptide repeat protein [Prochlorococcus marinus]
MDGFAKKVSSTKQIDTITTYPVPFSLDRISGNITIYTNSFSKLSKEKIISQAFKFHAEANIKEAIKYYQYFIDQGFSDPRVFSNYAIILKDLGNLAKAEHLLRKSIKINPNLVETHSNLGIVLRDLSKLEEAEISLKNAIKLQPNNKEIHNILGLILKDSDQLKAAEISLRLALKLQPDYADALINLGGVLLCLDDLRAAESVTRKAIELVPNDPGPHLNLSNILKQLGRIDEAEISARKAISLKPDYFNAYFNLSLIELLKGDYKSGFNNYELRFKKNSPPELHGNPAVKRIENKDLKGIDKLLVICEQGLGDTIQYMRYIPYLKKTGIEVTFCAQEKLHSLIQSSSIDSNPLTPEQSNKISDRQWISLLSLPKYLKVRENNPIITEPYIFSNDELIKKWREKLSNEIRPIIGINWQGNPTTENYSYIGRSLPLETFSTLVRNHDFKFLSLQKGYGSQQFETCSFKNKFVDCQPLIDKTMDFLEDSAIIQNCDLVITCDTSIAHLAGGIGKKVWLLLRDIPFWTWGLNGEKTPWYPSMRIFRQNQRHDWDEVMKRVSSKLSTELE